MGKKPTFENDCTAQNSCKDKKKKAQSLLDSITSKIEKATSDIADLTETLNFVKKINYKQEAMVCHGLPENEFKQMFKKLVETRLDTILEKIPGNKEVIKEHLKSHGIRYMPCFVDLQRKPLIEILPVFKKFLDQNRNEVITLHLDAFTKAENIIKTFEVSDLRAYPKIPTALKT